MLQVLICVNISCQIWQTQFRNCYLISARQRTSVFFDVVNWLPNEDQDEPEMHNNDAEQLDILLQCWMFSIRNGPVWLKHRTWSGCVGRRLLHRHRWMNDERPVHHRWHHFGVKLKGLIQAQQGGGNMTTLQWIAMATGVRWCVKATASSFPMELIKDYGALIMHRESPLGGS